MHRIYLFFFVFAALVTPAKAGNEWVLGALDRIDYLQIDDRHRTSYLWDGRFNALNGDFYAVTAFYRGTQPEFNMRAGLKLLETHRLRFSMPLHYDNGIRAPLYRARPYLGLGLVTQWAKTERLVFGFHLHDALKLGGQVEERPCHDGFHRAFHCGTGLPWTDAGPHLRQSNVATYGQFTVNWRF